MYRRVLLCLFAAALMCSLTSASLVTPLRVQAELPLPTLRLHRGQFDAAGAGAAPALPAALAATAPGPYAIVQLRGPVTTADRQALTQLGLSLLEYLPDYAYLVRATDNQLLRAARLPHVYAIESFTLADKLAPSLLKMLANGQPFAGQMRISGWANDKGQLARELQGLTFDPQAEITAQQLLTLAQLESVRWIEPRTQPHLLNDYARNIMRVRPVWQNLQIFGQGQIVAYADTGLDTGDYNTLSPDFLGRIVATHVLSDGAWWDDGHGHGTHVAGSIFGAGVQSGGITETHQYSNSFAGIAPEASIVVQAFEGLPDGSIVGLPDDYYGVFDQAYQSGARIHSDSWGDYTGPVSDTEAMFGGYPYGAQRTDQFVWDHPDTTLFIAAGNSGTDGGPGPFGFCQGGNGVIDPDSLVSPGTAKNVVTVGAAESNRSATGLGGVPWLLLSFCFNVQPIATDPLANNANGMAAFSSRGPTDDGRMKPDLVVPGTNIVSNRSHVPGASELWGTYEANPDHYLYSGGTSMATPLMAGLGALSRQWLQQSLGITTPTAALLKALVLNTTQNMAPGQYGIGATQEISYATPNGVNGWGRADAAFMTNAAPYGLWVDDHLSGLSTGETVTYTNTATRSLHVYSSTIPLRVMLVWTDPPASLSAAAQLVNDLDLTVTGPTGTVYHGNGVLSGDRINNVEGIVISPAVVGDYVVQINAFNVPIASQPYALVVAGGILTVTAPTPTPTATASATASATSTATGTGTATSTATATGTATSTQTSTATATTTSTSTATATATATATRTPTATATTPSVYKFYMSYTVVGEGIIVP